jgi:hypothetical protein
MRRLAPRCHCCQVPVGLGVSPLRGGGLSRCASSRRGTGVSPLDGHPSLTQHGQAGRAG